MSQNNIYMQRSDIKTYEIPSLEERFPIQILDGRFLDFGGLGELGLALGLVIGGLLGGGILGLGLELLLGLGALLGGRLLGLGLAPLGLLGGRLLGGCILVVPVGNHGLSRLLGGGHGGELGGRRLDS